MAVSGLGVAYSAAGFVLLWSGYRNATVKDTLTSFLKGQPPKANPTGAPDISIGTGTAAAPATAAAAAAGNTGASSASAAANQAAAKLMAAAAGHPSWAAGQQWADWVSLWNQESGWNAKAVNPSSGATGIPQLLPSAHAVPAGWSNPAVQIAWGISYIASTYGSPSAAWAHEVSAGWY